ncbi:aspartic peptidase A1 [Phlegmacium glaucopus]|nr:aspartic peptidase A1 [Phlegmacium glaucopus]
MLCSTILTTLFLALAISANPVVVKRSPVTLPLSRRVSREGIQNLVRRDQERANALKARGAEKAAGLHGSLRSRAVVNAPLEDHTTSYTASVGIGSPPTTYQLLVDTGSANTWVGANQAYVKTSTSVQTSNTVSVADVFSGIEFVDQLTIAPDLVISEQSIGVASSVSASNLKGIDGFLGIGPVHLSLGTLSPDTQANIPTVTDNLFVTGKITSNEVAISFVPSTSTSGNEINGELTWGGTDSKKFTGSITFAPITGTSPANQYWGIDLSIRYGDATTILSTTAGIIDTGTTLIVLATDAFQAYQKATGGVPDTATGLLSITSDQFSNLKSLFFQIGGTDFEFTPNAQIWPRSLNSAIGGGGGNIYLIITDMKTSSGQGLDFINGYAFLQRFYSVFDTANQRVGFATTPHTQDTTN